MQILRWQQIKYPTDVSWCVGYRFNGSKHRKVDELTWNGH